MISHSFLPVFCSVSFRQDPTPAAAAIHRGSDDQMLDLMYDNVLDCYFDPQTGKYYKLR